MPNVTVEWPGGQYDYTHQDESSLLASALKAGLSVDHACQRGDCWRCGVMVKGGTAQSLVDGQPVAVGSHGLMCQLRPVGDVVLALPDDPFEVRNPPRMFPVKIIGLEWFTDDIARLRFIPPKGQRLDYQGGQYIDIILKSGIRRSYSVYDSDLYNRVIECHIRAVPGGAFSQWLRDEAKVGDILQIRGPNGRFVLKDYFKATRTTFLATGTGIVPLMSMIAQADDAILKKLGHKILFWGNRTKKDVYNGILFQNILEKQGIELKFAFSRESTNSPLNYVIDGLYPDFSDDLVFAAGHPQMVSDTRRIVIERGLSPDRCFFDAFSFAPVTGSAGL